MPAEPRTHPLEWSFTRSRRSTGKALRVWFIARQYPGRKNGREAFLRARPRSAARSEVRSHGGRPVDAGGMASPPIERIGRRGMRCRPGAGGTRADAGAACAFPAGHGPIEHLRISRPPFASARCPVAAGTEMNLSELRSSCFRRSDRRAMDKPSADHPHQQAP